MRAGISAAIAAASILVGGSAWGACPPGSSKNCVNLDSLPQISQEIVASERISTKPKTAPVTEPDKPYTGPTVGVSSMARRAPTVGYRWSID